MNLGNSPFAESTLAGTASGLASGGGSPEPETPIVIDPFTIEISGVSYKGLVNTLSLDAELGRQGTAQFSLINLNVVPEIGEPVRVLFYDDVLFVGAVDRYRLESNNLQTFVRYDFECTDNSYLLFRRKVKATFVNQTPAAIATAFINRELFYDGITLGIVDVHNPIPVAEADGTSIFEFLNEVAVSVGAVFYIDNDKKLNFVSTTVDTAITPLTQDNIETCTMEIDRETYRNNQTTTVTGSGNATHLVVTLERSNSEQVSNQASIEGTSGVYSDRFAITHPSSNDTVQLTRLANAYNKIWLGIAGSIRRSITVRTRQYGYKAGQFVSVSLDHLGITGTWVIQRLSMREESGRFLIYSMELNQTSLIRRSQELWINVVNKGTIAVLPPTAILTNSQTFSTPGADTFTVPGGVTEVQVTVYGGGGGGGGEAVSNWPGYGGRRAAHGANGGGGGLAISVLSVTPGEILTLSIGAGGGSGVGQYLFESTTNALGGNGINGTNSYVSRSGGQVCLAYGGEGGRGGLANARFQQVQSWPTGRSGSGLFGQVITPGGAANGGTGGTASSGTFASNGLAGSNGRIIVEW